MGGVTAAGGVTGSLAGALETLSDASVSTAGPLGAGAAVSQLHWAVSASGGVFSAGKLVPFVPLAALVGVEMPLVGAAATGGAGAGVVNVGAAVPLIAALMLVCTPVTADLVSSTTAFVS